MTSRNELLEWFQDGVDCGASHMIVVCDTYDWEDYPVYVSTVENIHDVIKNYNGKDMQKVMEVYNLRLDKNTQIMQPRVFNL